jgi:Rieske Fe-S protein
MGQVSYKCQAKGCDVRWTDVDGDTARALNDMPFNGWRMATNGDWFCPAHAPKPKP